MAGPNTDPLFKLTPVVAMNRVDTANSALDASGDIALIYIGATNGTRIDRVLVKALGATTAGMVRLFVNDPGVGRVYLHAEIPVSAVTPSATLATFTAELVRADGLSWLDLPSGVLLQASTEKSEAFAVTALGGDY